LKSSSGNDFFSFEALVENPQYKLLIYKSSRYKGLLIFDKPFLDREEQASVRGVKH
jgi:hypothetical protein